MSASFFSRVHRRNFIDKTKELHDYEKEKYTIIHYSFNYVTGLGSSLLDVLCKLMQVLSLIYPFSRNKVEYFS